MSRENNVATVRAFIEAQNKGATSVIDRITSSDFVFHATGVDRDFDRDALKQLMLSQLTSFPDLSEEVQDIVAEGNKVAVRITAAGTHKGQFHAIAATGKKVKYPRFIIFRLKNGRIT